MQMIKISSRFMRKYKSIVNVAFGATRKLSSKNFPANYDLTKPCYTAFNESSPVWSCNEWDRLEEVIVGRPDNAVIPNAWPEVKACLDSSKWSFFEQHGGKYWADVIPEHWKKLVVEVDDFVKLLSSLGVKVVRPEVYDHGTELKFPYHTTKGFYNAMPRDLLMIVGDEIIEATMTWRPRYFEYIPYRALIKDYWKRGAKWTAAPKPTMDSRLFKEDYEGANTLERSKMQMEGNFVTTEFEPVFDAADAIRAGRDIFVQRSQVTNHAGIEWLRTHLAPRGVQVHELTFQDPRPMHIDSTFLLLKPGVALSNPERPCNQKDIFTKAGWQILSSTFPEVGDDHPLWLSSKWVSMNTLMFDEQHVFAEKNEPNLLAFFKKAGIEPIPISLRHMNSIGGGFHCWTCDIRRKGKMESYF